MSTDYLTAARAAIPPRSRPAPWKAERLELEEGPEVFLSFPLNQTFTKGAFRDQAAEEIAAIVNVLFDIDVELHQVRVTGTAPFGASKEDLPAVTLLISRALWQERNQPTSTPSSPHIADLLKIKKHYL